MVIDLQVQAYVSQPVMLASGEQTVYVVVQESSLAPVEGAKVNISLRLPSISAIDKASFREELQYKGSPGSLSPCVTNPTGW